VTVLDISFSVRGVHHPVCPTEEYAKKFPMGIDAWIYSSYIGGSELLGVD
jgi:hypothetical protein